MGGRDKSNYVPYLRKVGIRRICKRSLFENEESDHQLEEPDRPLEESKTNALVLKGAEIMCDGKYNLDTSVTPVQVGGMTLVQAMLKCTGFLDRKTISGQK